MIHYNFDLSHLNTLRLPAKAYAFARFRTVEQLHDLLAFAKEQHLPVKVLGAGSNVVMNEDIKALVVQSAMQDIKPLLPTESASRVAVDSGLNWHEWVLKSVEYGHGLENLALIPGTVGAAPVQNIGAYGVEVGSFIERVDGVQISTGRELQLRQELCQFAYRDSIFKQLLANDFVITQVHFQLPVAFQPNLSYGPLQSLADNPELTAEQLIDEVCAIRQQKLPDPAHIPNAGSFFKNPIVSQEQAQQLQAQFPNIPCFAQADGKFKLAAAWLIEHCGFKGRWIGNVRMHPEQALVLTTNGQADFLELEAFKRQVIEAVLAQFSIFLEPEPQLF